jgi:guanylate kinase
MALSVSHTTRQPRPKEVEGQDYYFVDDAAFDAIVADGGFAEWASVHKRRYGTTRGEVDRLRKAGKDIVLDIDVQGADQLVAAYTDAITVFILPPSMKALQERLEQRGTETAEQMAVRLGNARSEIAQSTRFQYIIVNESIEQAVAEFHAIIRAERQRGRRVAAFTERLLSEDER